MDQEKKHKKIISDMVTKPKKDSAGMRGKFQEPKSSNESRQGMRRIFESRSASSNAFGTESQSHASFEEYAQVTEDSEPASARFRNADWRFETDQPRNYGGCVLWIIAFVCIVAIVLGIGGIFARARVSVTPKSWNGPVAQTIVLAQNPSADQIAFATETQSFTDDVVVPATGTSATSTNATGTVRFYNPNTTSKTIPAGTVIVSSKNISYATDKKIIVPAKKGKTLGQEDVGVAAIEAGNDANSAPDDFTFANAKTFSNITIRSTTALAGGALANTNTADPATIANAQTQITQYFSNPTPLIARMTNEIPNTMIVLPIQIAPQMPAMTTDGTQSDGVHVIGTESITVLLVSKSDMASALGASLSVPQTVNAILPSFNNLTVTTATALAANAIPQTMTIHVAGTATIIGFVDAKKIQAELVGISRKQVRATFAATPEIQSFTIKIFPPWRHVFPTSAEKISMTVQ